LTKRKKQV